MPHPNRTLLTKLQSRQKRHDEKSHQDILSENMYVRLKHMSLHFFKYASKVNIAKKTNDHKLLRATIVDSIIICLASANALKIYLDDFHQSATVDIDEFCTELATGRGAPIEASMYELVLDSLLDHGGKMAKVMESTDHMEMGNPRLEMSKLVPKLTFDLMSLLPRLEIDIEETIEQRFTSIEASFII